MVMGSAPSGFFASVSDMVLLLLVSGDVRGMREMCCVYPVAAMKRWREVDIFVGVFPDSLASACTAAMKDELFSAFVSRYFGGKRFC
jgi:hypothetical protein